MEDAEEIGQRDLFELLPGVRGGRALYHQRGSAHMRAIGQRGGQATRDRYGLGYLRALAALGRQAWRDYAQRRARVVVFTAEERYRLVPYMPAGRRRRRPIWVRFLIGAGEE